MKTKKFFFILLLFSLNAFAASFLPQTENVPGGVIEIPLATFDQQVPEVTYQNHRVMVLKNANKNKPWIAIVGVSLATKPGEHSIEVISANQRQFIPFTISAKKYPSQYLTIKIKRLVTPKVTDYPRIIKEQRQISRFINHWSANDNVDLKFQMPAKGIISSQFGLQRFLNKQPREPHSGIDIAAPEGTPVYAPAAGKVLGTGNYFFTGDTLFIDHGQGLITLYVHLQKINVKPGQNVKQGELIGTIGKTGRATGPNLHWGVVLNGAKVNPLLFVSK